jgi:heptosyltransferase-2
MPRLLLVKLGAIGDVIMVIPAAYAMHLDGFTVEWMCGEAVVPLLGLYPWIHVVPVSEEALLRGSVLQRLRAVFRAWRALAGRPAYDLCATLYFDARYKVLTLPVRAARRMTLSSVERPTRLIPGRHYSSEYHRILRAQVSDLPPDGENSAQYAPIPVPADRLPNPPIALSRSHGRIVLIPAGSRNLLREDALRRWPIEHYLQLAQTLLDRGCEVILAGGPGDTWASDHFQSLPVVDLIGKLSLVESVGLFNSAALVVSHDTGPLHMAALTRTPIVAIFGPTNPAAFLPQRANTVALWGGEGFACRPCYDGHAFALCTHNGCMHQVTPAMVLAEIDLLLAAHREGRQLLPRVVVPPHTPLVTIAMPTTAAGAPDL